MNTINLLSIGTSAICDQFLTAILQTQCFKIYKTYSQDHIKSISFSKKYGSIPVSGALESVLKDNNIEAVYIASPTFNHYAHILLCLHHNKHVICEKPMVLTPEEYARVTYFAKKKKLIVFEAMRTLHLPQLLTLSQWIKHKKIKSVLLEFGKISSKYPEYLKGNVGTTFMPFAVGGGALYDLGIYALNLAVSLFGAPLGIQSTLDLLPNHCDGESRVILKYTDFEVCCFQSKIKNYPCISHIELYENEKITINGCSTLAHLKYLKYACMPHHLVPQETVLQEVISLGNDMIYEILHFYEAIHQRYDMTNHEHIAQTVYDIIGKIRTKIIS